MLVSVTPSFLSLFVSVNNNNNNNLQVFQPFTRYLLGVCQPLPILPGGYSVLYLAASLVVQ